MIIKRTLFAALQLMATAAFAQDAAITWQSTELESGLYMLEGVGGFAGGNLGLLTGEDGIVLIDDGLANLSAMTIASVEQITGEPVNFLINTHAHGDHTGANAVFHSKGATVFAHDNLRTALLANDEFDAAGIPEITFADSVTFHLNGYTAKVFHLPNAHTDGDSAIHFSEVNIIHAGDVMFNGMFPFIDLDGGGSVDGFIAGQGKLLSMADDDTRIIPGHGKLASKADLKTALDMLVDAKRRVQTLLDEGKSRDEIQQENPLSVYDDWSWDFITTEKMTDTLFRSLTD
jgi:glyoxylase-like metal-dependent hydrolase (beta-lactamase superfamily II)